MRSLGNFPDPFSAEIAGQPDALRRAAAWSVAEADRFTRLVELAAGRTLIFTGMGSSYDACYPAVAELARAGVPAIMVDSAELLHFRVELLGPTTMLIAVSQSGESAEVVRVARSARAQTSPPAFVAVTNGPQNSLADLADVVFDTAAGPETGPSTMTFVASLVVVGTIGRVLAATRPEPVLEHLEADAGLAAVAIERILDDVGLPDTLVAWLEGRTTVVILGRGPARAAAEMGALTIKEAVAMPIESLQTAQFRHGPLEMVGPSLAAIIIATEPETQGLDLSLSRELIEAGAAVYVVSMGAAVPPDTPHLAIGPLDRLLCPAVSIVPAQLLAWRLSVVQGREPGTYHRASKVTTRE
jgi:glutamine---fructose-6-phosphate transaminase (isomerizing)